MDWTDNRPISEQYYEAAMEWVDAEAAASLLEDTKSAVLAQRIAMIGGDMAHNKAENAVKASDQWMEFLTKTVDARTHANRIKVKMEAFKMRFQEWQSSQANERLVAKM